MENCNNCCRAYSSCGPINPCNNFVRYTVLPAELADGGSIRLAPSFQSSIFASLSPDLTTVTLEAEAAYMVTYSIVGMADGNSYFGITPYLNSTKSYEDTVIAYSTFRASPVSVGNTFLIAAVGNPVTVSLMLDTKNAHVTQISGSVSIIQIPFF